MHRCSVFCTGSRSFWEVLKGFGLTSCHSCFRHYPLGVTQKGLQSTYKDTVRSRDRDRLTLDIPSKIKTGQYSLIIDNDMEIPPQLDPKLR